MAFKDDWKVLDAQKQSIFLIFNAKYIKTITPLNEEFMIIYGVNRYHFKSMLIDLTNQRMYFKITQSEADSLGLCKSVLVALLEDTIDNVMKKYDFVTIAVERKD